MNNEKFGTLLGLVIIGISLIATIIFIIIDAGQKKINQGITYTIGLIIVFLVIKIYMRRKQ